MIGEFSADDFIGLHLIEGLAYQYWRASALLRSIGKGCEVILNEDGSWTEQDTVEQAFLIASIDSRTAATAWDSSSLGVWFDPKAAPISRSGLPTIDEVMVPVYNTSKRETGPEYWQGMGLELPIKARTNYLPGVFNARHFLHSHSFLDAPFEAQYGYSLSQFICATTWSAPTLTSGRFVASFPSWSHRSRSGSGTARNECGSRILISRGS